MIDRDQVSRPGARGARGAGRRFGDGLACARMAGQSDALLGALLSYLYIQPKRDIDEKKVFQPEILTKQIIAV